MVLASGVIACADLLGIPSEVDRADGGARVDAAPDVATPLDADVPDRITAADADAEAAPPPPLCNELKSFGTPVPLTSLNTAEDDGAGRLSEDELTIYLDAPRIANGPGFDIYFATRTSLTDSFSALKRFPISDPLNPIDTPNDEYAPTVTADGLTLMFERQIATDSNIYITTRANEGDPFGPVSEVANLNTGDYEANVFLRGDTKELWHVRKPIASGPDIDISLATLVAGGYAIEPPAGQLVNVNSTSYDGSPVISKDGLALYFSSSRPAALGATNIWVATRVSRAVPFNKPVIVANVNSAAEEYPGFISGDGCRLYLSSKRAGGRGGQDLYVATKPR